MVQNLIEIFQRFPREEVYRRFICLEARIYYYAKFYEQSINYSFRFHSYTMDVEVLKR